MKTEKIGTEKEDDNTMDNTYSISSNCNILSFVDKKSFEFDPLMPPPLYLKQKDLKFVEGLKNYVSLQLEEEQVITQSTLKSLMERLPSKDFIQVHKSYIVALAHIERIDNDTVWIHNRQLPIGNTFRKVFFESVNERKL